MNAVIRKPDSSSGYYVVVSEDVPMEEGFGELRADVRHIRSEATDIKADVRATNVRLDDLRKEINVNLQVIRNELGEKLDDLASVMTEGQKETATRIDRLTAKIDDVKDHVDNGRIDTADKIERIQMHMDSAQKQLADMDSAQKQLADKVDGVQDSLGQAKVWALGLYIGLAGALLLVIAHGFKWL
jgi:chromosome segregation ATPase